MTPASILAPLCGDRRPRDSAAAQVAAQGDVLMPWPHGIREAATAIIIPWDGGLGVSYTSPPQPAGSARTSSCRSWQAPGSSHSERLLLGSPFELSLRRRRSPLPGNGISRAEKKTPIRRPNHRSAVSETKRLFKSPADSGPFGGATRSTGEFSIGTSGENYSGINSCPRQPLPTRMTPEPQCRERSGQPTFG